jgi:hypothetical protein
VFIILFFTHDHLSPVFPAFDSLFKNTFTYEYTYFGQNLSKIKTDALWLCVQSEKTGEISYAVLVESGTIIRRLCAGFLALKERL